MRLLFWSIYIKSCYQQMTSFEVRMDTHETQTHSIANDNMIVILLSSIL